MKHSLPKRALAALLAALVLIASMNVTAFAAVETEPTGGWNSDYSVLEVKGTPADWSESDMDALGDYANGQSAISTTLEYKLNGKSYGSNTLNWENIKSNGLKEYVVTPEAIEHNGQYTVSVKVGGSYTIPGWMPLIGGTVIEAQNTVPVGSFTLKIFDVLTINTVKDDVTTTTYEKVYRGDPVTVEVAEEEGCNVTVTGAVSADAPGSYQIDKMESSDSVTITYTEKAKTSVTVTGDSNVAVTTGTSTNVEPGTQVEVTATPAENYYISGASIAPAGAWDSESYEDGGKFVGKFTTDGEAAAYTVSVAAKPVIVAKEGAVLNYWQGMSDAAFAESLYALVDTENSAPEVDKDHVTYSCQQLFGWSALDKSAVWAASQGDYPLTVRISYTGGEDSRYPAAVSQVITVTVGDSRYPTAINVKEGVELEYKGEDITTDTIIQSVLSSVTYSDGDKTETIPNAAVTAQKDSILQAEIIKAAGGYYVFPVGSVINYETESGIEGDYKINLYYAGTDKEYQSATAEAYFSVKDHRAGTELSVTDASEDMTVVPGSYDEGEVLALLSAGVTDPEDGAEITDPAVRVTSVYKDGGSLPVYVYTDLNKDGKPDSTLNLTEAGEYTVTVEYPGSKTHKPSEGSAVLTLVDARPETEIKLVSGKVISYTAADPITDADIQTIFQSVNVKGTETVVTEDPSKVELTIVNGAGETVTASQITQAGTYTLQAVYGTTTTHMGSEATTTFAVSDGRNVTRVNFQVDVTGTVELAYDWTDGTLTAEEVYEALGISVVDTVTNEPITDYQKELKKDNLSVSVANELNGSYQVSVSFAGNAVQAPCSALVSVTLTDQRAESGIDIAPSYEVPYGTYTADSLLADLLNGYLGVIDMETGEAVAEAEIVFIGMTDAEIEALNVGEYTLTVEYTGNTSYKPSTTEITLSVVKAPVHVTVTSGNVRYQTTGGSYNAEQHISVNPEADYISFAVGLKLGENASADAGLIGYVDLPQLIDLDSIESDFVRGILESALDQLGAGSTMSISQLKTALEGFLTVVEGLEGLLELVNVNLDTQSIEMLVSALEQIERLEGVGELTVKLTMGKGLNLTDSGVYLVGAVTSDANYQTAYGLNYLVIAPDGKKAELDWIIADENGFVTLDSVRSGAYDLGAKVTKVYEGTIEGAEAQLVEIFIGVDMNGNATMITDQKDLTIGAYTEIAYIRDLGNEMYYAQPIVRPVVVVADLVDVKFIDENGNENNDRLFTYDGTPKSMTAVAYDRSGSKLPDQENISYRYIGVESDGEGYYSTEPPTAVGTYTVIATYVNPEQTRAGMAVGTLVITPAPSGFQVQDTEKTYDGNKHFADIVNPNGLDYIAVVVDDSSNVNILLPESWNAGSVTVNVAEEVQKLIDQLKTLPESIANSEAMDEVIKVLEQVGTINTLSINGTKPVEVGVYNITGIAFGVNVSVTVDEGVLTIVAPHEHKHELKYDEDGHWNECECGDKTDAEPHTYGDWTIIDEATEDEIGLKEHTCTVCGYTESEIIPMIEKEDPTPDSGDGTGDSDDFDDTEDSDNSDNSDSSGSKTDKTDKDDKDTPKTGDSSNALLWTGLALMAVVALIGLLVDTKKRML